MLERAGVRVMMAGDTHAFEYYVEDRGEGQQPRRIHHFVNGGGGAYLSIGGALAWPALIPTKDLGVLSEPGSGAREARCRDAGLEAAGLAMDQAVRRLAG